MAFIFSNRPVSLTCVPCKLLDHIVFSASMAFLENVNFFQTKNTYFGRGKVLTVDCVINNWAKISNKGSQVDTFILDLNVRSMIMVSAERQRNG